MTDHTPTPREHELPNGDLAVSSHWVWGVRDATTVADADRPLYRLLMDVLADAHVPDCMPARLATACEELVDARDTVMNIERGVVDVGNVGYGMSYCHTVRDAIDAHRDRDALRLVAVGCSGSKHDVAGAVPAKDLYRRSYWTCKREYGETIGDEWQIISAEHAVLDPNERIEHYERTPDDLAGVPVDSSERLPTGEPVTTLLDQWAYRVYVGITRVDFVCFWRRPAGYRTGDPARPIVPRPTGGTRCVRPAALRGDLSIWFPFQEVEQAAGGNGNQMGWMTDEVAARDDGRDRRRNRWRRVIARCSPTARTRAGTESRLVWRARTSTNWRHGSRPASFGISHAIRFAIAELLDDDAGETNSVTDRTDDTDAGNGTTLMTTDTDDTDDEYTLDDEFGTPAGGSAARRGRPRSTPWTARTRSRRAYSPASWSRRISSGKRNSTASGWPTSSRRTAVWVSASTTATAAAWRCRTTWKRQSRSQRP